MPSQPAPSTAAAPSSTETEAMPRSNSDALGYLPLLNLVSYVINVAVTYGIGVAGLFNLPSNSVQSEKYQTIVTPVGWAFSIWGIIFLSQGIWAALQFVSYTGRLPELYLNTIRTVRCYYFIVVISQSAWTLLFATESIFASAVMMSVILWNLGVVVFSLDRQNRIRQESETELTNNLALNVGKYFLLEFPFSVHFGWILAATVVNANVVLVAEGFSSDIQYYGAIGGLVLLLLVAVTLALLRGFVTIPLVASWALFGVYSELGMPKESIMLNFTEERVQSIRLGSVAAIVVVLVSVAYSIFRKLVSASVSNRSGEAMYLRANDE